MKMFSKVTALLIFLLITNDSNLVLMLPVAVETPGMFINEVNYHDGNTYFEKRGAPAYEFIELYDGGRGNIALDSLFLARFNHRGLTTSTWNLTGYKTDEEGFFVIGGVEISNRDLDLPGLSCNKGGALALYQIPEGQNGLFEPFDGQGKAQFLHDVVVWKEPDRRAGGAANDSYWYTDFMGAHNPQMPFNVTRIREKDLFGTDKSVSRCSSLSPDDRINFTSFTSLAITPRLPNFYCESNPTTEGPTTIAESTSDFDSNMGSSTEKLELSTTEQQTEQASSTADLTTVVIEGEEYLCYTPVTLVTEGPTSRNPSTYIPTTEHGDWFSTMDLQTSAAVSSVNPSDSMSTGQFVAPDLNCTCPSSSTLSEPVGDNTVSAWMSSISTTDTHHMTTTNIPIGMTTTVGVTSIETTINGVTIFETAQGAVICPTIVAPTTISDSESTQSLTSIDQSTTETGNTSTSSGESTSNLKTTPSFAAPTCGAPPVVAHAWISAWDGNLTMVNSTVTYKCRLGYSYLDGNDTILCQESLIWTQPPKCFRDCSKPSLRNATVTSSSPKPIHNEAIDIKCETGFFLKQENEMVCKSGEWFHGIPTCHEFPDTEKLIPDISEHKGISIEWGLWMMWTTCTTSCGEGSRVRVKLCHPNDLNCTASDVEYGTCFERNCPVAGVWNPWGNWSDCSSTCNAGTQSRSRDCLGPFHDGYPCEGKTVERQGCLLMECPDNGRNKIVKVVLSEGFTKSDERTSAKTMAAIAIAMLAIEGLVMLLMDINPYTVHQFFKNRCARRKRR